MLVALERPTLIVPQWDGMGTQWGEAKSPPLDISPSPRHTAHYTRQQKTATRLMLNPE